MVGFVFKMLHFAVDRNPQTFCNIFTCDEDAFVSATQRVHSGSRLEVLVL